MKKTKGLYCYHNRKLTYDDYPIATLQPVTTISGNLGLPIIPHQKSNILISTVTLMI
jgi:hypothetical protein